MKRNAFLEAKLTTAKERLRKRRLGWKTCPFCAGMGEIWNRFNHSRDFCPFCDGEGIVSPEKLR